MSTGLSGCLLCPGMSFARYLTMCLLMSFHQPREFVGMLSLSLPAFLSCLHRIYDVNMHFQGSSHRYVVNFRSHHSPADVPTASGIHRRTLIVFTAFLACLHLFQVSSFHWYVLRVISCRSFSGADISLHQLRFLINVLGASSGHPHPLALPVFIVHTTLMSFLGSLFCTGTSFVLNLAAPSLILCCRLLVCPHSLMFLN
jgi:hypothetical protein